MNLKNLFSLKIRTEDFNNVVKKPDFINKLRKLTLHSYSGMNHELSNLEKLVKEREVDCKILMAYRERNLVGWALLSKESTKFSFVRSTSGFQSGQGFLFQIYVDPNYRRQGIGSELFKVARKKSGKEKICICPWDYQSDKFYSNFEHIDHHKL